MKVGELFAGIGGFGLAATQAGCEVAWASEIDNFASRVYAVRFPTVRLLGDVTKIEDAELVDLITAGFPCQDLSVAGKRKGLVGERSGLFWEIIRVAQRLRPRWLLLENVPGLLSSHRGRNFETVLAALDDIGYGVAWRVLDAQFFGVPQCRRRVFIVGHLGGPCPAEVLFEPEGVPGNPPTSSEAGPRSARGVAACLNSGGNDGGFRTEPGEHIVTGQCHGSNVGEMGTLRQGNGNATGGVPFVIQERAVSEGESGPGGKGWRRGVAYTLEARHHTQIVARPITATSYKGHDEDTDTIIAHSLTGEGHDAGEDGTGRGTPIVAQPLRANRWGGSDSHGDEGNTVLDTRPRRLTPRECERLQGFPDDWTLIDGASDSARYRALGNAVAVPCVEWIIRRVVRAAAETPPQPKTSGVP